MQTPAVLLAQARLAAVERERGALGAERVPTVDGWIEAGAYASSGMSAPYVSSGLAASVPLWLVGRLGAELSEADAGIQAARAELDAARADAAATLRSLYAELNDRGAALAIADAAAALALDEVRQAEERFEAGVGSSFEVVDAQASAAEAERARIDVVWLYNRAVVAWRDASGFGL